MKYKLFILLSGFLFLFSNNCLAEEWDSRNTRQYINDCATVSTSTLRKEYKRVFKNILEPAEYDAFIQATSEQAREACQCIVSKIKDRYTYQEVINHAPPMLEYAQQISQEGGECEQNGEALLSKMRAIINPRQ